MGHWIDDSHFHWQSQNATEPSSKRGQEIICHAALGIDIHLFVRENKLAVGKAANFTYHGRVRYQSHQGNQLMSVGLPRSFQSERHVKQTCRNNLIFRT